MYGAAIAWMGRGIYGWSAIRRSGDGWGWAEGFGAVARFGCLGAVARIGCLSERAGPGLGLGVGRD